MVKRFLSIAALATAVAAAPATRAEVDRDINVWIGKNPLYDVGYDHVGSMVAKLLQRFRAVGRHRHIVSCALQYELHQRSNIFRIVDDKDLPTSGRNGPAPDDALARPHLGCSFGEGCDVQEEGDAPVGEHHDDGVDKRQLRGAIVVRVEFGGFAFVRRGGTGSRFALILCGRARLV